MDLGGQPPPPRLCASEPLFTRVSQTLGVVVGWVVRPLGSTTPYQPSVRQAVEKRRATMGLKKLWAFLKAERRREKARQAA